MDPSEIERVKKIAQLARLEVSNDEARRLAPQFARILEHFQTLAQLELPDVEPMAGATGLSNVQRADEPRPSLDRDELLAAAPDRRDDFYGVPKTIGGDA